MFVISLASHSSLVLCLGLRQGAYPRVINYTRLEWLADEKHTSLLVGGMSDE
jgi:hypothetical protein